MKSIFSGFFTTLRNGTGEDRKSVGFYFGWKGTPEQEQALLRIIIPSSVLGYLLVNKPEDPNELEIWFSGIKFVLVFLSISFVIYSSTIIWGNASRIRKCVGIITDSIGQSYAMLLTGPIGAPWYGLYLWIILGNGFRYGNRYLFLSTAISFLGFVYVSIKSPYWSEQIELAIGLALTLLLIPTYSSVLIRRLNEARQRADAASRAKSDFLSCMSHEIRTPLNGILGMTDLLKLRPLSAEDKDCIETIHVSGHALARQINEILDLSKIEAGKMTLEVIDFDLYVLVNTTMRIFQSQAADKNISLVVSIAPDVPYLLSGDPHKLRQIITNLVGNAIKFTNTGSVSISISQTQNTDAGALIRFEITDTGTGIPENKLQTIFEPFTQASESVTRNYGGTGLGTTICKNLVELMKGKIGIESTLDVGSTFWFEIPFDHGNKREADTVSSWAQACRIKCLLPDSTMPTEQLRLLEEWNIDYTETATPADLLASAVTADHLHAILVDEDVPGVDTAYLQALRTAIKTDACLIIISRQADHHYSDDDETVYVLKPDVSSDIFLKVLHACYSRHGTEEDITDFSKQKTTGAETVTGLNILVADDNPTNRLVLQRMLDRLGHSHTIVDGGEAALNELERNSFDAVIIDMNMPDMGGLETYQAYQFAHGGEAPVKFAILTADATEEARKSCSEAGIEFFLTKPVSLDRLTETLGKMNIGSIHKQRYRSDDVPASHENTGIINVLDKTEFDKLRELSGGDNSFIRQIVENFMKDTNENIRLIEVAVAGNDWLAFRDHAHALKGSALYLGLQVLAEKSKQAQDITADEFATSGTRRVVEIRKAADEAFDAIRQYLAIMEKNRIAS